MSLWNEKTAAEAAGGKAQGSAWQAARVEIDSRKLQPGDLFVAIKGDTFDGHDYAADALKKGAAAAIVSRVPAGLEKAPLLIVRDTLEGLVGLGRYNRARSKATVIGITGSVGKTSAKEMLKLALSAHGPAYATGGNYNNHIGTPLNLANMPPDVPFAVLEMGMNHAGEISHLSRLVKPDVAAVTNVEAVHMEFFASLEAIANAKAEIFDGMAVGSVSVLNLDNPLYSVLASRAREEGIDVITFGRHPKADIKLTGYQPSAAGCKVTTSVHGKALSYTMQAVGRHWALTSLLVIGVTHALGLSNAKTVQALAGFSELEGRGRTLRLPIEGGEVLLIDDSYNASPASMRAAFNKTSEVWQGSGKKGRKLAALGDMLELGDESAELHEALAEDLAREGFHGVFTAGPLMKHLHDKLPKSLRLAHVQAAAQLHPLIVSELKPDDILLVKGSHGSRMVALAKMLKDMESSPPKETKDAV